MLLAWLVFGGGWLADRSAHRLATVMHEHPLVATASFTAMLLVGGLPYRTAAPIPKLRRLSLHYLGSSAALAISLGAPLAGLSREAGQVSLIVAAMGGAIFTYFAWWRIAEEYALERRAEPEPIEEVLRCLVIAVPYGLLGTMGAFAIMDKGGFRPELPFLVVPPLIAIGGGLTAVSFLFFFLVRARQRRHEEQA